MREGAVVLEDGRGVDLVDYVLHHPDDLVLKPCLSYGGAGVVVGADPGVTPAAWRDALQVALRTPYVVQRMVRPVPELFPVAGSAEPAPWTVVWGVFTASSGYAGVVARGTPTGSGGAVVNLARGDTMLGCGFHVSA